MSEPVGTTKTVAALLAANGAQASGNAARDDLRRHHVWRQIHMMQVYCDAVGLSFDEIKQDVDTHRVAHPDPSKLSQSSGA